VWVVGLATFGLIFDGYDLVVYGTVVSTFLRDPSQIGEVSPEAAGALGSYALVGVLVGALIAGTVGDIVGRRKVMLTAYAWFAIGMGLTALTSTTSLFGLLRFLTGLGVGALVATTGALVAEYAPPGKKNLATAITYSGVPVGSLLAALLAILLLDQIGWRGMFWIGALPLVTCRWRSSRCPSRWPGWPQQVAMTGPAKSPSEPGLRFPTPRPAPPMRPGRCAHPRAGRGSPAYSAARIYCRRRSSG
jgi:AAHS family benzoate transporter-like MFS transporter